MSAAVRRLHNNLKFSPFNGSCSAVINSNERRKLAVGISKVIKLGKGYRLCAFSRSFCPFSLVEIMKLLVDRNVGFAFFKFTFCDVSDRVVLQSCMAVDLLVAEDLRLLAQDVLAWVIQEIGEERRYRDGSCALEVVDRMREVGVRPSVSAICVLFKLLLRLGDYGSVWKLFRDMVGKGPGWTWDALNWVHLMVESGCNPSTATFSTMNAFSKEGNIMEARKIFDGMQEMGMSPGTKLYNALMDGYVKAREVGQANMLYQEMRSKGVAPDGLCWARRLDEALELLENMLEKGIPLSVIAFNSLIVAYGDVLRFGKTLMIWIYVAKLSDWTYHWNHIDLEKSSYNWSVYIYGERRAVSHEEI
ncbi:hypothetical protein BUALT_Bualt01G0190300 [Buddleja alternifolia]|uniref:Pentatricopeptide repeat-containing protein n=1 Tax=Buddleja alternifolia TaxID=168488 RepID=A0AAV6YG19_9LAMI|nr:hypothetical protein BUALT_Bualt01G0190300 [Buddleja alternifolia]